MALSTRSNAIWWRRKGRAIPNDLRRDAKCDGGKLWDYLGCPVVLADQVQPEAPFPFVIYSVTTPYIPDNTMGDYRTMPDGEDSAVVRRVMPTATFSFTCCSMNRGDDGAFISGADEAYELADEANGLVFAHRLHGYLCAGDHRCGRSVRCRTAQLW